jgi:hypothetical protein
MDFFLKLLLNKYVKCTSYKMNSLSYRAFRCNEEMLFILFGIKGLYRINKNEIKFNINLL